MSFEIYVPNAPYKYVLHGEGWMTVAPGAKEGIGQAQDGDAATSSGYQWTLKGPAAAVP